MKPSEKVRQLIMSLVDDGSLVKFKGECSASVLAVEEGEGTLGLVWRKEI